MKRKLWTLLLALILAVCVVPMTASATSDFEYRIDTYSYEEPACIITGYTGTAAEVVIPAEIEGYPVKEIYSYTFKDCTSLTSVVISEGITTIGSSAFDGCTSLSSITIPESVTSIEHWVFWHCTSLTSITIPQRVTSIEDGLFAGCSSLTDINIPKGVTAIGGFAFSGCSSLTDIQIPEGVTAIGERAFWNCASLTSIVIPDGVTSIGSGAFEDCSSLTSITIPEGITTIGSSAFCGCKSLTSIHIPENVTSIGDFAFSICKSLTEITIPEGVTSIGDHAFSNGEQLEKVVFLGSAPERMDATMFNYTSTVCCYPKDDPTWTPDVRKWYGYGKITWVAIESGHTPGMPVGEKKEPTCTEPGSDDIVIYCADCGEEIGRASNEVAALGHIEIKDFAVAPTCTATGLTAGKHCSVCEEVLVAQTEVPALGHTEAIVSAVAASCTDTGLTEGKHCSVCGEILVAQRVLPALGHEYMDGVCTRCGQAAAVRIAGGNRISTALTTANKLKEVLGVEKFDTILVANAMNFPDALSGSYLAAAAKAPILLYAAGQNTVTDYIKANLSEGGTVYILGGESSVPESLVSALPGIYCERVSGSGRWATSLAIIAKADSIRGTKPEKVLICDGTGFADSLSASATGLPILLVNGKGTLREDQKAYLESVRGAELYAIGGTSTITPALLEELKAYDEYGVERVFGSGREQTSATVAKKFFPGAKTAALASSLDFPDGLSGGPVAYAMGAPLLLTRENKEAAAKDYVNSKGITSGYIIGGEKAVSDESAAAIFGK